jgi:BirA family transcriptional regulator, biotin operon repressor / biotin---[acetyl-CoA-carboxylase] ligase
VQISTLIFDSVDSTNTVAADHARRGAPEGLCVIANQQTAGRGRHGRTWISDPDSGLYFSIVLRPKLEARFLPLITLMAGAAAHDTIAEYGLEPDIKWVNDILIGDDKICGILAESIETNLGPAVILGIGINLTSSTFPGNLTTKATSIELETGRKVAPAEIAQRLTAHLQHFYALLSRENGPAEIITAWQERSSYFSGKDVRVDANGEIFEGVTSGLEPNGALRVRLVDGSIRIVESANVTRLRAR